MDCLFFSPAHFVSFAGGSNIWYGRRHLMFTHQSYKIIKSGRIDETNFFIILIAVIFFISLVIRVL